MKFSNKIIIFVVMLCGMLPYSIAAQESTGNNRWYFGVGGGYRSNHLSFSNIDDDIFPTSKTPGADCFRYSYKVNLARKDDSAFVRKYRSLIVEVNLPTYTNETTIEQWTTYFIT